MARMQGKRTLITGGTSGIGLEAAKAFIAEGARVVVTGQNPETLQTARETLGPQALVLASNAASLTDMAALARQIEEHYGALDALFINAGVAMFKPLETWSEEDFDRIVSVNFKGPFFLIQALLPLFAQPASVVFTSSGNAHMGMPNSSVYGASKAAVNALARTLSGELAGRGIRFNIISPGPVDTPIMSKQGLPAAAVAEMKKGLAQQIPAGRIGQPEEIARAAVFLVSDESAYMLGSEIVIDGGMSTL